MAKALTEEQRKLRLEIITLVENGVDYQLSNDLLTQEEADYIMSQLKRVAKFLCVAN